MPVYFFILLAEINRTLATMMPSNYDEYGTTLPAYSFPLVIVSYVIVHLFFGIIVGLTSSTLSIKFGSRYRCSKCDISFSRMDSYQKHFELVHSEKPIQLTRILILGGGFAGSFKDSNLFISLYSYAYLFVCPAQNNIPVSEFMTKLYVLNYLQEMKNYMIVI